MQRNEREPATEIAIVVFAMLLAIVLSIAGLVYMAGCAPVVPPPVGPDAGPPPPSDCELAGERLQQLGCVAESVCTERDCDDFAERCEAIERDIPGYLNVPCLAAATDCDEVNACAQ